MTHTRGNVIVEEIKVGDIHYEFEYNFCVKTEVITKPTFDGDCWNWKSKKVNGDTIVNYSVNPNYTHYSSKLYDYEAYAGCKYI